MLSDRPAPSLFVLPHCRLSRGEGEDQSTFTRQAFARIAACLGCCRRNPGHHLLVSGLDVLSQYGAAFPADRDFLGELAAAGRLHLSGCWNDPGDGSLDLESVIRNLAQGRAYGRQFLEHEPYLHAADDARGHCLQLPQILRRSGFEAALWFDGALSAPGSWLAVAPDGSRLLAASAGSVRVGSPQELAAMTAARLQEMDERLELHDLLLVAEEMPPPARHVAGSGEAVLNPAVVIGGPRQYFEAVTGDSRAHGVPLPTLAGDLAPRRAITTGLSGRPALNRLAEDLLLSAETLAAVAALHGAPPPDLALNKGWRQLLYAQGQHRLTGRLGEHASLDLLAGGREICELATGIRERALDFLLSRIDTTAGRKRPPRGRALVVFNPLAWKRSDVGHAVIALEGTLRQGFALQDGRGRALPLQITQLDHAVEMTFSAENLPALGWQTYYLVPAGFLPAPKSTASVESGDITAETDGFVLTLNAEAGGAIRRLFDKRLGRELVAPGEFANVVSVGPAAPARITVEAGPVLTHVAVTAPGLAQDIWLYPGRARIDFFTRVEPGEHERIAVRFPTARAGQMAVVEDRGAVVVRRPEANVAYPIRNWIECGASARVVAGETAISIGPCAVISGAGAAERALGATLQEALLRQGIPCTPFTEGEDFRSDRQHSFRIVLDAGAGLAYRKALLEAAPAGPGEAFARRLENDGWAALLMHDPAAEEGDRVPVLLIGARDAESLTAAVNRVVEDLADSTIEVPAEAIAAAGPAAEDYGLALLSRQAAEVAWSPEGALSLSVSAGTGARGFEYALYPHAGDWRAAGVARAAREYNSPPIAREADVRTGDLPAAQSVLSVSADNLIVTAFQPAVHPPTGRRPTAGPARSESAAGAEGDVTIRAYECHGRPAEATFELAFPLLSAAREEEASGQPLALTAGQRGFVAPVGPCAIETFRVQPAAVPAPSGEPLGPVAGPGDLVHCRYWDYNLGAGPIGGPPVGVFLSGDIAVGAHTRLTLTVVNEALDQDISGMVRLTAPADWMLIPAQVPYRLGPGRHALYELALTVPADASGFLRAEMEHLDARYQDALAVGSPAPLAVSLRREPDSFVVRLENVSTSPSTGQGDAVEGRVALITPMPTWGEVIRRPGASVARRPDRCRIELPVQPFFLAPGEQTELTFTAQPPGTVLGSGWAVAKVMYYGQVQYVRE